MHPVTAAVTARIVERSREARADYLARMEAARHAGPGRAKLSCANWAHAFAASPDGDKQRMRNPSAPNVAIVSAYNDMLSAHQPLERFPEIIKAAAETVGATAQFAGGVPAMCDGVTQGRPGMELSLFSRDVIAMSTAVALTHDAFDAALMLGVCDKIVPGLTIGALAFGHLPVIFVPGGPMTSGASNAEKARVRGLYAEGKATRDELLDMEMKSYHGPGTCTFYGTANSNQMMMEMMGLHLPGAAFVTPNTPLRDALTAQAPIRAVEIADGTNAYAPMSSVVDEKSIVNAIVGLLATGGSTNHTLHIVAMARAAGVIVDWTDFDELSRITPLMARVYPNGSEDVNAFHAAGGMAYVIRELLDAGLAHEDVVTVAGEGLRRYQQEPFLEDGKLVWREGPTESLNPDILRPANDPFLPEGGIRLLSGGLGRAVIKTSAVKDAHLIIEAPAIVFEDQDELLEAYKTGELNRDFVAVVRFQGPQANGMPELHSLTPVLGVLQDKGFKVALVTDGRMSGASGKVPAAIHVSPEAGLGGPLAYVQTGDIVRLDAHAGVLEVLVEPADLAARSRAPKPAAGFGYGRELFGAMRRAAGPAEAGACTLFGDVA
ncbi:MAG: phosphogluconate dehydratase [Phenylobacterium sp.]|jgi:phosphogluconate dehydratase|uniref:phosphogluconate dehydratase n=1 Tax=Phenylobacterium sp. TaxID=1871053 RepID=UPI001B66DC8B|nr:phosphogluconate dehydratase [Phenylobacterium sp.]MBP7649407.1 phosphogluconate dehydratase [Phenylobacterium sp.]MBP7816309.1 phosphogluconate dehydratase [Phenylobacterium sp.]MBP9230996.1 phosphogluconate dehydratase [Phenylobacterium sp.]MBP9754453.1 phosphogluconate dehydratase [Phenylobacterium sp.]